MSNLDNKILPFSQTKLGNSTCISMIFSNSNLFDALTTAFADQLPDFICHSAEDNS